MFTKHEVK